MPEEFLVQGMGGLIGGGWNPADWWTVAGKTCLAAYQPKGAPSLADSYINLANRETYNAAPISAAPTFGALGWTCNGTTQSLTTGIVPSSTTTALIRFSSLSRSLTYQTLFGMYESSTKCFLIQTAATPTNLDIYHNNAMIGVSQPQSFGIYALAGGRFFVNGTFIQATTPNANACTATVSIGNAPITIQAFVLYAQKLSDAEVAGRSSAMAAL